MPSLNLLRLPRAIALFAIVALLTTAPRAQADDNSDFLDAFQKARQFQKSNDHAAAIREYQRALPLSVRVNGANGIDTGTVYHNMALSHVELGLFTKAKPLYVASLEIYRVQPRKRANALMLANSLRNAANVYSQLNENANALSLFTESYRWRLAILPPDDPAIAESLSDLGREYFWLGQLGTAEAYHLKSLEIRQAKLPADDPQIAQNFVDLGQVYLVSETIDKSETYLLKALSILEKSREANTRQLAHCLANLAAYYILASKYDQAGVTAQRSLKLKEEYLGPSHPDLALDLDCLGHSHLQAGRIDKAKPLYERSKTLREAAYGPEHSMLASSLHNLAMLDVALGNVRGAAAHYERTRRAARRYVARELPALNDSEQISFLLKENRPIYEVALSLALHARGDAAIAEQSAGWLANGKALIQHSLAERAQTVRDVKDMNLSTIAAQLRTVREELAGLAMAQYQPGQEAERKQQLARLIVQEQTLAKQVATARGQAVLDDPWVTIESIRKSLPAGSVLVDIAKFERSQFPRPDPDKPGQMIKSASLGRYYAAWIVPPAGAGDVRVVELGSEEKIDAAVAAYQKAIAEAQSGKALSELGEAEAEKLLVAPLAEIAKLVLDPLLPHLKDADQLILSPDGALWLTPWAALPAGEGKYAVERWQIRYIIAGREVVLEKLRTSPVKPMPPRIFANPDYDLPQRDAQVAYNSIINPGAVTTPNSTLPRTSQPGFELLAMRSASTIGRVARLPGTAAEAASVAPNLKAYTGEEPRSYLDKAAQEAVFKRLASPRVLLLSTHGFFLADQRAKVGDPNLAAVGVTTRSTPADSSGSPIENPLLRCGLLLTGCNERDKWNSRELGDGILTGLEIVGTDLRGTELVVLSACETGLGVVNNGEGVAGLRQAFQLAGAKSVVSTLWQIPDKQSVQLMTDFFANLAAGQSKAEALRNAQLTMIKARRERDGEAHPIYWAAWTVTGQ